jgi:hypothetical protein
MPQRGIALGAVALVLSAVSAPLAAQATAAAPAGVAPPGSPGISLSIREVPAAGRREALLTVERFGRYSLRVASSQGTALEVIDRMAGSLGRAGEAGRENGRLDLLLDRGSYKLVTTSHEGGSGVVRIEVLPFRDPRTGPAPRLPETRLLDQTLDDLEQLSWWLEVAERREVRAEAAGRNLADLRLWRDGSWLDTAAPECVVIQPVVGRPLQRCRIATVLLPGLYLLVASGGPSQPWAEAGDEHPLHVRWGAPRLPAAGRRRFVVSPFGEDWFRLPDEVNFLRLELPEARPARLSARWLWGGQAASRESGAEVAIGKESVPPVAELEAPSRPTEPGEQMTAEARPVESYDEEPSGEEGSGEEESVEEGEMDGEGQGEGEGDAEGDGGEEHFEETEEDSEEPAAAAPTPPPGTPLPPQLWVSVSGAPGQAYVLQHFERRDVYSFAQEGPHWISTVHSGAAEDSVDATALLTDDPPDEPERLIAGAAVGLDARTSWARRFNLLETATLFLEIRETGKYRVALGGTAARARVEPFFLRQPDRYKAPDFQRATSTWDLDAGFYVLTLEPEDQGIVDLRLGPAGLAGLAGLAPTPAAPDPVRAAARFAPVTLDATHRYTVVLNQQPGVHAGVVLRRWPVDLSQALPVAQRPGEELALPFTTSVAGTLRAEAEDGSRLELSIDGGPWLTEAIVDPGEPAVPEPPDGPSEIMSIEALTELLDSPPPGAGAVHQLAVRHGRTETVSYSLWVEPLDIAPASPLPALPDAALAGLPQLPVLAAGAPRFLDLGRSESATFLVRADRPGLYAVRSTGLLATAGTLRTRTVPSLRREEANGVGRNFLLQQYLREGDYQATVQALGASRGHLGLALESVPLLDGGELREGIPGHFTLPAGQAVAYRFTVGQTGDHRLRALGLGFTFRCRLEDADGWPLERPDRPADLRHRLAPGTYRIVLLPQPVEARALLLLERTREPLRFTGHGPHPLPLEQTVEHVWTEPAGEATESAERPPDLWRFEVPAEVRATVALTEEMEGRIVRLASAEGGATDEASELGEVGAVPPGRSWSGTLTPGSYQIEARCFRRNNLVRYQVSVQSAELVAGQSRSVKAPASVPLSVGREGLFELTSFSPADVRAVLRDAAGQRVAADDDRPDGWNFLLLQRLLPGRYQLDVEAVGAASAPVTVALRAPAEVAEAPLALPFRGEVQLGGDVQLRTLPVTDKADLLLVTARSRDSLGMSVEARPAGAPAGEGWRTLGTAVSREPHLAIPLDRGEARPDLRLRLWSLDRQGTPVRLQAAAVAAPRLNEADLRRGAVLPAVQSSAGFEAGWGAARVELDRPGVLALSAAPAGLAGSGLTGMPLAPITSTGSPGAVTATAVEPALLSVAGNSAWLVAPPAKGSSARGSVRGARVEVPTGLDGGSRIPVPSGQTAVVDLAIADEPGSGPLLALVTAPDGQPGLAVEEKKRLGKEDWGDVPSGAGEPDGSAASRHLKVDENAAAETWGSRPRLEGAAPPEAGLALRTDLSSRRERNALAWGVSPRTDAPCSEGIFRAGDKPCRRGQPSAAAMAVGPRTALAVSLAPRSPVARVWDAGTGEVPAEVLLRQVRFPAPAADSLPWGVTDGRLEGLAARRLDLPAGAKKLRLSLGEATVGVLSRGDEVLGVHWRGGAPFEERLDAGAADRLTLLHTGEGADPFAVEVLAPGGPDEALRLAMDQPLERSLDRAGTLRLALPEATGGGTGAGAPMEVHVRGTGAEAVLLGRDGSVMRGTDLPARSGGTLLIHHEPGLLLTWMGAAGESNAGLWGSGSERDAPPLRIAPPATVPLAGSAVRLAVSSTEPHVLHLRTAAPLVTLLQRGAGLPEEVEIHPASGRLDVYLPAGEARLGLRAVAGAPLSGTAELTVTPVTSIAEGLGPQVIVPTGGARWFSFEVARSGPIGAGVHADSGRVEIEVYDHSGRPLPGDEKSQGSRGGVVRMLDLEPGTYLLALRTPADAPPVAARPALAGLALPDTGPPEDIVRQYLQYAGADDAAPESEISGSEP